MAGFVIGIAEMAALASRPFIGHLADSHGRKFLTVMGTGFLLAASSGYFLANDLIRLSLVRVIHGLAITAFTTGGWAMIGDLAPEGRRGEAIGYYGAFTSLGIALSPAIGLALLDHAHYSRVFLGTIAFAAVACALAWRLPETYRSRHLVSSLSASAPVSNQQIARAMNLAFSYHSLIPSLSLWALTTTTAALYAFLPLALMFRGMSGGQVFFPVYAGSLVVSRALLSRITDRFPPTLIVPISMLIVAAGLALLAYEMTLPVLVTVALIYGASFGTIHSALIALTMQRSPQAKRGVALSTLSAGYDAGMLSGAVIAGVVAEVAGFSWMFITMGSIALLGALFLLLSEHLVSHPEPEQA